MARKAKLPQKKLGKPKLRGTKLGGPALIVLAAIVAMWPLLVAGPSCGGDFYFHFVSWSEAQRSMLQGILYPHWANSPNFGLGEPRFVFYPPLSWMAGALLGLVFPWKGVALVLDFLLLAGTGLANRALAREALEDGAATLAGCASIFLGRSLSDISMRCDFAELTGGFWIPLLLMFLLRNRNPSGPFRKRAFDGSTLPLALVITGIWLSNGPLGIEANYLLAAVALVSAVLQRSWAPVARATVSLVLGMGLSSVYLVPAVWERNWANFQDAINRPQYLIENSWLFAYNSDPSFADHDRTLAVISVIAFAMFAVSVGSMLVAWKRGTLPGERQWWIPLALIPFAVFLLLIPVSHPIWNWLPEFRLLQFPWRWLLLMQPALAVFFAAAVWVAGSRRRTLILSVCAVVFFAISVATWAFCFRDCRSLDAGPMTWEQEGGAYGKPEYAPQGVQYTLALPDVPSNCVVEDLSDLENISGRPGDGMNAARDGSKSLCTGKFVEVVNMPEHKGFSGVADRAGYLILPLRSYPAWAARVNGHAEPTLMERGHGLMAIPVTPGQLNVEVKWTTTEDVIAGRWLSALSPLLLSALYFLERKFRAPLAA